MKALLFVLALLCSDSAWAARSLFQVRCEETISKAVAVLSTQVNGYTVDNSRSYRSLTSLKGNAPSNAYVLGLTRAESRLRCHSTSSCSSASAMGGSSRKENSPGT